MVDSGEVLTEARRVFGETAELHYGVSNGNGWATAGLAINDAEDSAANEITCWGDDPLTRMLACLRALPEASP